MFLLTDVYRTVGGMNSIILCSSFYKLLIAVIRWCCGEEGVHILLWKITEGKSERVGKGQVNRVGNISSEATSF